MISSSNGKDKKRKDDELMIPEEIPSPNEVALGLSSLFEKLQLEEYISKRLEDKKVDSPQNTQPIISDAFHKQERDRFTFGNDSPRIFEDEIAAPRFEKSSSVMGSMLIDQNPVEEKDIPMLRAYSESALNNPEPPLNSGGFSLSKPGLVRTPLKSMDRIQEDTFGRKGSVTRAFSQLSMKSSDKKLRFEPDESDKDIFIAAEHIAKALEGQL